MFNNKNAFLRASVVNKGILCFNKKIRINEQYRICFMWSEVGPKDVEVTDYH